MSHFFYIHRDISGNPDVWKVGQALTPYSAVRARQKFCWNQFGLDYLWFGYPNHVDFLEKQIKLDFHKVSGKVLNGYGAQTEMLSVPINKLLTRIEKIIGDNQLCIQQLELKERYTASNSKSCIFGIPGESNASDWLDKKAKDIFKEIEFKRKIFVNSKTKTKKLMTKNTFDVLFSL